MPRWVSSITIRNNEKRTQYADYIYDYLAVLTVVHKDGGRIILKEKELDEILLVIKNDGRNKTIQQER